jgi:hypothetical protein
MLRDQKRRGAAGVAVLILCVAALVLRTRHHRTALRTSADAPARGDRWHGFETGTDAPRRPDAGPDWFSSKVTPEQVDSAMAAWRAAIIDKQADAVLTLDQAFSLLPGRYGPALAKLAETDPEERVRAFSTRVLGKMKNVALVEDFQRLLADKSTFVRQNAAWALGELASRPGGREAAEAAFDDLRQIQDGDPATEVRTAATNALRALQ